MKAILEFQLPEETEEHKMALDGMKYSIVLHDLDNYLRNKLKYEDLSELQNEIYQEIRDKLYELSNEEGVEV